MALVILLRYTTINETIDASVVLGLGYSNSIRSVAPGGNLIAEPGDAYR